MTVTIFTFFLSFFQFNTHLQSYLSKTHLMIYLYIHYTTHRIESVEENSLDVRRRMPCTTTCFLPRGPTRATVKRRLRRRDAVDVLRDGQHPTTREATMTLILMLLL